MGSYDFATTCGEHVPRAFTTQKRPATQLPRNRKARLHGLYYHRGIFSDLDLLMLLMFILPFLSSEDFFKQNIFKNMFGRTMPVTHTVHLEGFWQRWSHAPQDIANKGNTAPALAIDFWTKTDLFISTLLSLVQRVNLALSPSLCSKAGVRFPRSQSLRSAKYVGCEENVRDFFKR